MLPHRCQVVHLFEWQTPLKWVKNIESWWIMGEQKIKISQMKFDALIG